MPHKLSHEHQGLLLCLVSATGFAAMAIFAKFAYAEGANVVSVLAVRFVIAAALLWQLARMRGAVGSGRALVAGALLGLVGYAGESGLFFASLTRLEAPMASLVLFVYPAMVLVVAVALGQDHVDRRRALALAAALSGVALVLVGGDMGALDGAGVLMALGAAAGYALYVVGSHAVADGASPLAFAASVCTGAANAFVVAGVITGELELGMSAAAYGWILALAIFSTVIAIAAFLGGLARLGPGRAAIVSSIEPPITVGLAALCFGETLGPVQLVGGALVVAAVALLARPGAAATVAEAPMWDSPADGAPASAPAAAPARAAA